MKLPENIREAIEEKAKADNAEETNPRFSLLVTRYCELMEAGALIALRHSQPGESREISQNLQGTQPSSVSRRRILEEVDAIKEPPTKDGIYMTNVEILEYRTATNTWHRPNGTKIGPMDWYRPYTPPATPEELVEQMHEAIYDAHKRAGLSTLQHDLSSKACAQVAISYAAGKDAKIAELEEEIKGLRDALQIISAWKTPSTERTWDDGSPMSYEAIWGSNGARDYMKSIASEALNSSNTPTSDITKETVQP